MSMMARFVAITAHQLAMIKDTPEMVAGVFAPDAGLPFESSFDLLERLRRKAPQLVADMFEHGLPNPRVGDAVPLQVAQGEAARRRVPPAPGTPGHSISLDKAWHGLHYLLCGAPEPVPGPLGQAVFGGSEIGEDQGYGPARYFSPAQVAEIAAALQAPGLERDLRGRFDGPAMTRLGIYPGGWEADEGAWLIEAFHTLRDFYAAASKAERAVVTLIE